MIEFFCFLFGLVIFSFAGVCIDRIPKGEDIVHGRSHCDSCGTDIQAYDLIPVVSFILLKFKSNLCPLSLTKYWKTQSGL